MLYFCLQVVWEVQIVLALLVRLDNVYDLFFFGFVMLGVKSVFVQRRLNIEIYVFCFDGINNGELMQLYIEC